jgi:hypothetical protein
MRSRIVGCVGVLVVASACASSTGATVSSRTTPTPQQDARFAAAAANPDSVVAQAIADREGPSVTIRATLEAAAGSRRVRANFHADDDAYVVIGHIDPDGVLRIVFPEQPGDDGFIKGDRSYQTTDFFAGFNDQYNFRYRSGLLYRSASAETDSYDRGLGYVFIIATWRPMRFDRFSTDGDWDSFELADADYMKDPRPAVYELASLLSGENREAYTVKFARYYTTQSLYGGYDSFASDFNGLSRYCAGYTPAGFASSPFDLNAGYLNRWNILNGYPFTYRGTYYAYDPFGACYRPGAWYNPYSGYSPFGQIAQTPVLPPGSRRRGFSLENHRGPIEPQPSNKVHAVLQTPPAGSTPATSPSRFSPAYRSRGLITEATEPVSPRARRAGVQAVGETPETRSRPGFSEMVNRRGVEGNEGTPGYRTRARVENGSSSGWTSQSPRPRSEPVNQNRGEETRQRFNPSDSPRSAPAPRESSPRYEAPTRASSPPPSAPPPRMEAPRVESHPVSAPPPSAPPASSSSHPIKPPGR